jgi:hypothetical protein
LPSATSIIPAAVIMQTRICEFPPHLLLISAGMGWLGEETGSCYSGSSRAAGYWRLRTGIRHDSDTVISCKQAKQLNQGFQVDR